MLGNRSILYYLDIPQVPPLILRAESSRRKLAHRLTGHVVPGKNLESGDRVKGRLPGMKTHNSNAEIQTLRKGFLARIRHYAEENVLPNFDTKGPFTFNIPRLGGKSLVYYLDIPHVCSLVLRAEPSLRRLKWRIANHDMLFRLGLLVPKVLYRDLRFRTRLRWGYYFMAEQKLEGTPFKEYSNPKDKAASLGETFARLHRYTAEGKGYLGSAHRYRRSKLLLLRKKARQWLARYRTAGCPQPEQVRTWLDRWPEDAWTPTPRLCKNDIAATNILVHGEAVSLLDLSGVKLSSALIEMVRIRQKTLCDHDDAWEAFLEGYLRVADLDQRREIDRFLILAEALHRIRLAGESSNPDKRADHCRCLFKILESRQ